MPKISKIHEGRERKKKAVAKYGHSAVGVGLGRRISGVVLLLSSVLVGVGIYVLLMIYGPVMLVEAGYQFKSFSRAMGAEDRGWIGFFVPNFSYDLTAIKFEGEYGIVIPKIFIKEAVVLNVDPTNKDVYLSALAQGIAHAAGTALPGDGGLGYYFAHSSGISGVSTGFNAKFYLLGKLEVGDEVVMYRDGERYEYKVIDTKVTSADDVSFLDHEGEERIVLQTCWPVGTSAKRLVVTAERVI